MNSMDVLCDFVGRNERVNSSKANAAAARHAPKGSGAVDGDRAERDECFLHCNAMK